MISELHHFESKSKAFVYLIRPDCDVVAYTLCVEKFNDRIKIYLNKWLGRARVQITNSYLSATHYCRIKSPGRL